MSHPPRFQVLVVPNVSWEETLSRFNRIEALGFDLAAVADHFVDWTQPSNPWLEAWTLLAALARETTTIRLTTCVTQIPLRHPAMLARQALTVDHISGGRLEVGLGIGLEIDPSYRMMGIPNWPAKERVARFKEYVEVVRALLTNEVTSYRGRFYEIDEATMVPPSPQRPHPPITIGALAPVMLKRAATYADTWNSMSFAQSFDRQLAETRERIRQVDAHCEAIGRDPASLRRSYSMFDPAARHEGGLFAYYRSEGAFTDMAHALFELGVSELSLYYPIRAEQMPVFERIATEVLPQLRRAYAA